MHELLTEALSNFLVTSHLSQPRRRRRRELSSLICEYGPGVLSLESDGVIDVRFGFPTTTTAAFFAATTTTRNFVPQGILQRHTFLMTF